MVAQAEDLRLFLESNGFTPSDIDNIANAFPTLPPAQQKQIADLAVKAREEERYTACRDNFMEFVDVMWSETGSTSPEFISGFHHEEMAEAFEAVEKGESNRIIINMPPRHSKTVFASILFPAWYLGRHPNRYVIQAGSTVDLAIESGGKLRDLMMSTKYQKIFPGTLIRKTKKAVGDWRTTKGGSYFAVGVKGRIVGRGAHLLIIDDPHSEQSGTMNASYDDVFEWYGKGPRQRLQSKKDGGGAIIVVMTRWHKRDLTARLIEAMKGDDEKVRDDWTHIQFPAILGEGTVDVRPLWPEFWTMEELRATKEAQDTVHSWNASYMQDPSSEEAAIVKREWWLDCPSHWYFPTGRHDLALFGEGSLHTQAINYVIQCWDTALSEKTSANFSACTTWGVFLSDLRRCGACEGSGQHKDGNNCPNCQGRGNYFVQDGRFNNHIVLLSAFQERLGFPELKERALREYRTWKPDKCMIETKAAGLSLVQELRHVGIPVSDTGGTPSRGDTKLVRVNSITDLFKSGFVWAPDTRWAEEVVEQFASFQGKSGDTDDLVDSSTYVLQHFRKGGFIRLYSDESEREKPKPKFKQRRSYYWNAGSAA